MNHKTIENSSNILSYGYDYVTQQLEVVFKSKGRDHGGSLYRYEGVSWDLFEELEKAESKGSFIQQKVVRGGFKFTKSESEQP